MAFLDNLELLIDAALTDYGREALSRGDGSFKVTQFAPVDTEIDYTLYNTTSGDSTTAPASILDTPILEPNTNESTNEQYELMTIASSKIQYLPVLNSDEPTAGLVVKEFLNGNAPTAKVKITPQMTNNATIPAEIVDTLWFVYVNDTFLEVTDYSAYLGLDSAFNTAGYALDADNEVVYGGRAITVTVRSKPIDDTTWTIYADVGTTSPSRTITTIIKVKGAVSGLSKNISVVISEQQ